MLQASWHFIGVLLVLTATAGDFANKIILPQVLNDSIGGGASTHRNNTNTNNITNNYNNAKPTSGSKSATPAMVDGMSPNGNTVLGSNGLIVASGVPNAPTSNLNSKWVWITFLTKDLIFITVSQSLSQNLYAGKVDWTRSESFRRARKAVKYPSPN